MIESRTATSAESAAKAGAAFRFTLTELVGSFGDLGTLLPLLCGLIAFNGIEAGRALTLLGATYICVGLYYRLPVPIQPLKATAMIAIAAGATAGQIRAAALWMAGILLFLSLTRLVDALNRIFPKVFIGGLQFGLGLMMVRSGVRFAGSFPDSVHAAVQGVRAAPDTAGLLPAAADFRIALFLLVLPQIPLTLGNAVLATRDCAQQYFGRAASHVTAGRLASTIGIGNLAAGLVGGMPMCHGAGGMTAHYHTGARSGAAPVMLGAIFLGLGIGAGNLGGQVISAVPAWVLGVLLAYVGVRHMLLARSVVKSLTSVGIVLGMGVIAYFTRNLLAALAVGLGIKLLFEHLPAWVRSRARR